MTLIVPSSRSRPLCKYVPRDYGRLTKMAGGRDRFLFESQFMPYNRHTREHIRADDEMPNTRDLRVLFTNHVQSTRYRWRANTNPAENALRGRFKNRYENRLRTNVVRLGRSRERKRETNASPSMIFTRFDELRRLVFSSLVYLLLSYRI